MEEELEKLSSLGVQKIYDDTHIPVHHIQALLRKSFDGFSRVQFLGFISILEREYHYSLVELKLEGLRHFDAKEQSEQDDGLLVMPKQERSKKPLYIGIIILFLAIAFFAKISFFDAGTSLPDTLENSLIEDVQEQIIEPKNNATEDMNETQEENLTQESVVVAPQEQEEQNATQSFEIVPRSTVWLGYIDVVSNKKHQTTLSEAMNLDANRSWLLLFGHGYIDMYINGVVQKFDSRNKIRFLYEDGTLKAISSDEFKELNRGLKW